MLKFLRLCCPKKTAKKELDTLIDRMQNDQSIQYLESNYKFIRLRNKHEWELLKKDKEMQSQLHKKNASILELEEELETLKDQMLRDQRIQYLESNYKFIRLRNKHEWELLRKDKEMKSELRKKDALILELKQELAAQKHEISYPKDEDHL